MRTLLIKPDLLINNISLSSYVNLKINQNEGPGFAHLLFEADDDTIKEHLANPFHRSFRGERDLTGGKVASVSAQ